MRFLEALIQEMPPVVDVARFVAIALVVLVILKWMGL